MWTCRHVLICADMCRYVPTCSITFGISDINHLDLICMLACVSTCGHADMCWYVPTCADISRYVPTYDIILSTSDTNHLDLCSMLACVSTCGHADMLPLMCADMSQHVASLSAPLIPIIGNLSVCKMSIYPVRFTYLVDRFKRKGSKPIHGRTNSKNISRNTKYKDTETYYLMNCLLQDITLWLGIMNQFHSLDVILIPVS